VPPNRSTAHIEIDEVSVLTQAASVLRIKRNNPVKFIDMFIYALNALVLPSFRYQRPSSPLTPHCARAFAFAEQRLIVLFAFYVSFMQ
jgi:hypothetical protein